MAAFRETALPVVCAECGARVLVPQGRLGVKLKCPKCAAVLTARPPAAPKPPVSEPQPLGSSPSAAIVPSTDAAETDVAAEIDALLFGDLSPETPSKDAPPFDMGVPDIGPPQMPQSETPPNDPLPREVTHAERPLADVPHGEVPSSRASPSEMHRPEEHRADTPHSGVVAFDAPADADEYKLSEALGHLPLPPSVPPTDVAPASQSQHFARGERELRQTAKQGSARSRMQHESDEESSDEDDFSDATGSDRLPTKKVEKFTPDATLADPRRAFLRGVFEFPFYFDVIPQWIKLAFALTIELGLAWWIVDIEKSGNAGFVGGGLAGGIAIGSLLLVAPAVLLGSVWIAMTWAVGSAILEDTAAGLKHVENWPESLILDDLPSLIFPAAALFFASLPGLAINWFIAGGATHVWSLAVSVALLFPFVLLSILETGSVFLPFSMPIFRCVYKRPGTWAWFYAESMAVVAVAAWIAIVLWGQWSILRISLAAVLATAAIMIYFRLLGRLGLVCANQASEWEEGVARHSGKTVDHQPSSAEPVA